MHFYFLTKEVIKKEKSKRILRSPNIPSLNNHFLPYLFEKLSIEECQTTVCRRAPEVHVTRPSMVFLNRDPKYLKNNSTMTDGDKLKMN